MGQEVIGWTGPGRSWKGAGWSVFYNEPTALLNPPKEVLFFQSWGTPRDPQSWGPVWEPELGLMRPSCPDLSCGSSNSADLGGSWFECLSCGKMFPDASFYAKASSLVSAEKVKSLQLFNEILKERQEFEDLLQEKKNLHEAEGRRIMRRAREEKQRAYEEEIRQRVERAKNPPSDHVPPKPAPTRVLLPVYDSMVKFCEKDRERQIQRRAVKAYCEWLARNPDVLGLIKRPEPKPKPEPWTKESTGPCPGAAKSSGTFNVEVLCSSCGHSFWHYFPFGVARPGKKCPCCK